MLVNETNMRSTLVGLSSKLQNAEPRLRGRRAIHHRIRHLELQECCETLLEDVNRGFGDAGKHLNDVSNLEKSVDFWLARLEDDEPENPLTPPPAGPAGGQGARRTRT